MKLCERARRSIAFLFVFACVAAFWGPQVFAEAPDEDESPGIPAYSISRLKVLTGTIYARTTDSDWGEATTNTPLQPNSRISAPPGSEAEIQFHAGQFVLLPSGTDIEVVEMSEEKTRFRLRAGEIRFDLPGDDFAPVSVRVPGGARVRCDEPGRYWLTVTDEDTTHLVVRRGRATVSLEGETTRILEGQEAVIGRTITVAQYKGADEPVSEPRPLSAQEQEAGVPPVVSYELRDYGGWVYSSSYGYVWQPRVADDWSPYVYGRWTWVSPYGWTWVSYEPWGWYPYRTGFWVTVPGIGWAWTPYGSFVSVGFGWGWGYYHKYGYNHHRNFYYRPANVRFVPDGRGIGWAPLRPGERYRPPRISSTDPRLSNWNRPLDRGRVYVAQRGQEPGSRQWADIAEVQAARDRASAGASSRVDMRQVRPELGRPALPSGRAARNPGRTDAPLTSRDASSGGRIDAPSRGTPSYGGRTDAPLTSHDASSGGRTDAPSRGTPSYGGRTDAPLTSHDASSGGRTDAPSRSAPSYGGRTETPSYGERTGGPSRSTPSYGGRIEAPSSSSSPSSSSTPSYGGRTVAPSRSAPSSGGSSRPSSSPSSDFEFNRGGGGGGGFHSGGGGGFNSGGGGGRGGRR